MEINGQTVSGTARYDDMGLSAELMRAIEKKGYVEATPIQTGAIPRFMEWKDVIAKAPTGTGKTFAFGIPMVEHTDPAARDITGLVLAPTRELAIQITDELRDLCAFILSDHGEHRLHQCRGGPAGVPAAHRHGQVGDNRRCPAVGYVRDFLSGRAGLLHAVHAPVSGNPCETVRGGRGRGAVSHR